MSAHLSNTAAAQRARLLEYLQQHQKITTLQARSILDVLHVAGRVQELREDGVNIITQRRTDFTPEGKPHRVAEYVLMFRKELTPAATGIQDDSDKTMGE